MDPAACFLARIQSIRPAPLGPDLDVVQGDWDGMAVSVRPHPPSNGLIDGLGDEDKNHTPVSLSLHTAPSRSWPLIDRVWVPTQAWKEALGAKAWPAVLHDACQSALHQTPLIEAMRLLACKVGQEGAEQYYRALYKQSPLIPMVRVELLPQGVVSVGSTRARWDTLWLIGQGPDRPRIEALYQRALILEHHPGLIGLWCQTPPPHLLPFCSTPRSAHTAIAERRAIIERFERAGIAIASWV